jgi:predicted nucleic acid-binding protein
LLTNDTKAIRAAVKQDINVLNISAFLLLCKRNKFLKLHEITEIINDLKIKDFYEFGDEELEALLQE